MKSFEIQCLHDLIEDGVIQFTRSTTLDSMFKAVTKLESEGLSASNIASYLKLRVVSGSYNLLTNGRLLIKIQPTDLLSNMPDILGLQIDRDDGYIELHICWLANPTIDTDTLLSALPEYLKMKLYCYYIDNNFRLSDMESSAKNINIFDISKEMDMSDIQQVRIKADTLPCEFISIFSNQLSSESGFVTISLSDILQYVKLRDDEFDHLISRMQSIFILKDWSVQTNRYELLFMLLETAMAYQCNDSVRLVFRLPESMLQPISELFKIIDTNIVVSKNSHYMIEVIIPDKLQGKEN